MQHQPEQLHIPQDVTSRSGCLSELHPLAKPAGSPICMHPPSKSHFPMRDRRLPHSLSRMAAQQIYSLHTHVMLQAAHGIDGEVVKGDHALRTCYTSALRG